MKVMVAIGLLAATLTCSAATAPIEIKGIRLGATAADVEKRFTWPGAQPPSCSDTLCMVFEPEKKYQVGCEEGSTDCTSKGEVMFGPAMPIYYGFTLVDGKVAYASIAIDTADFAPLMLALVAKYGKPSSDHVEIVQNAMSAKFDNRVLMWVQPDGVMRLEQRSGKLTEGQFVMSTKEYLVRTRQKQTDKAFSDAKKL